MREQRNILLISVLILMLSTILSCYCWWVQVTGGEEVNKIYGLVYDISIGVVGGAVLGGIISVISYSHQKKITLERYYDSFVTIIRHAGEYEKTESKFDWYRVYRDTVFDFSKVYADIKFIIDFRGKRRYLFKIYDYYNMFILLSQDSFKVLAERPYDKSARESIDNIIFYHGDVGFCGVRIKAKKNSLTDGLETNNTFVHEIYRGKGALFGPKYDFCGSLINDKTFIKISNEAELFIREYITKFKKRKKGILVTEDVMDELQKKGYIRNYYRNKSGEVTEVNYTGIFRKYFTMKEMYEGFMKRNNMVNLDFL